MMFIDEMSVIDRVRLLPMSTILSFVLHMMIDSFYKYKNNERMIQIFTNIYWPKFQESGDVVDFIFADPSIRILCIENNVYICQHRRTS
jgi:hypothetical protein